MQRYIDELRLLHALRLAVVATDTEGMVTFANDAAVETLGCAREELVGRDIRTLIGDAGGQPGADLDLAAVLNGETWRGDLTVHRPAGGHFVAAVSATPVRDTESHIVGAVVAAEDMTEIRAAEADAAASEARLRLAHEAAQLGSWHWDSRTGITVWDEALEVMYGMEPGTFGGSFEAWIGTVHPDDREHALNVVQNALEARSSYVLRNRVVRGDGALQWIEAHGKVTTDEAGNPTGTIGCVRDITEEMAVAEREHETAARAAVLQEVTAELTGALSPAEVHDVVTRGVERIRPIVGDEVRLTVPADLVDATGASFVAEAQLGLDPEDKQLLETLAAQASISAERARLQERTRYIAEQLQSSLAASPLPDTGAFEIAAHYSPGGDELEHVGGDWYDAVAAGDGALALVVGDVMGRGVRAATSMIRVRAGIRGLVTVDPSPEAVLRAADEMIVRDAPDQFVTAVALLADPASRTLVLGNAGHVPVVLVRPDGSTELLGDGAGVPLGVAPDQDRTPVSLTLERGSLLVMVTDGVVESRGQDLDEGLERLRARATELRDKSVDEIVDELAHLADPSLHDDVTVVAARLR